MEIKFFEEKNIVKKADKFRKKYSGENRFPIEIEKIIDFELGIEIRPENHMEECCDADALITSDFKVIMVDNKRYLDKRYDNRFRFSLAHEIGHLVLHKKVYSSFDITSLESGYKLIEKISEKNFKRFEWQANRFASHLLIPRNKLSKLYNKFRKEVVSKYPKLRNANKLDSYLAKDLSDYFGVSEDATEIALNDVIS